MKSALRSHQPLLSWGPILAALLAGGWSLPSSAQEGPTAPNRSDPRGTRPEVIAAPAAQPDVRQSEGLQDAWAIALEVDRHLAAARWQLFEAEQELQAARSQRWPSAYLNSAYLLHSDDPSLRFSQPTLLAPVASLPFASSRQWLFQGYASLPIYTSQLISSQVQAASAQVQVEYHRGIRHQLDLKLHVAQEYLAVLRAEQEVEVAESQRRNLAGHTREVEARLRSGRTSKQNLLTAQVALSTAEHQAIVAHHSLDLTRATYNRSLGRPLTAPVRLQPVFLPDGRLDGIEQLTQRAWQQSPELQAIQSQIEAAGHEAEAVRAETKPRVDLLGAYSFVDDPFRDPGGLATAGIGVTWNVFDGGAARHRATARRYGAQALTQLREDVASQTALDVRRAWLDVRTTRQGLTSTQRAIGRAEENLRVTRARFAAGTVSSSDRLAAEFRRIEALRNHFNAQHDVVLAHLRLLHATVDLLRF